MLCPSCGADVGESLSYCENCQDAAPEPVEPPAETGEETAAEETHSEAASSEDETSEESSDESVKKKGILLPVLLLLVFFAALFVLFLGVRSLLPEQQLVDVASKLESLNPIDAVDLTGQKKEAAKKSPVQKELYTSLTEASGFFETTMSRLAVEDALVLYQPALKKFEIAFFSESLSVAQRKMVLKTSSFSDDEFEPQAVLSLWLKDDSILCSASNIKHASLELSSSGQQGRSVETLSLEPALLKAFSCQLKGGETLHLETVASLNLAKAERPGRYSWELATSAPIYFASKSPRLAVSTEGLSQLALWSEEDGIIELGFYERLPTAAERGILQTEASLVAVKDNQPVYSVIFELNSRPQRLRKADILNYGVRFHALLAKDGARIEITEDDPIGVYFVPTTEETSALTKIDATLFQGASLKANMRDSAMLETVSGAVDINWAFKLDSPILRVTPIEGSVPVSELGREKAGVLPGETFGSIDVGGVSAKVKDAVALWYAKDSNLVLALYGKPVEERTEEAIERYGSVWIPKQFQQPLSVVFLDMKGETKIISRKNLNSISLSFVRQKLGSFYFSGRKDKRTVKKPAVSLASESVLLFDTPVEDSARFSIRARGSEGSKKEEKIVWNFSASAELKLIKRP